MISLRLSVRAIRLPERRSFKFSNELHSVSRSTAHGPQGDAGIPDPFTAYRTACVDAAGPVDRPVRDKAYRRAGGLFHVFGSPAAAAAEMSPPRPRSSQAYRVEINRRPIFTEKFRDVVRRSYYENLRFIDTRGERLILVGMRLQIPVHVYVRQRNPQGGAGRIPNILFKNLSVEHEYANPSRLAGFSKEHDVRGVHFVNYAVAGKVRLSAADANVNIGPFVFGVIFAGPAERP